MEAFGIITHSQIKLNLTQNIDYRNMFTIKYSPILKWKTKQNKQPTTIVGLLETHTRLSLSVTLIVVFGWFDSTRMSTVWNDTLTFYFFNLNFFNVLFLSCSISFVPFIIWRVPPSFEFFLHMEHLLEMYLNTNWNENM